MNPYEVEALVEKAAALMTQFERRGRELEQRQQAMSVEVPVLVRQSVDTVLQTLPRQVQGVVHGALEQVTRSYEQRLGEAGARVHVLAQQIERMERVHRHVVWKTFGVAACALLALTIGGAALAKHYFDKMQENRLDAELLQAYNTADVAPCGKGQLCANGPQGPALWGSKAVPADQAAQLKAARRSATPRSARRNAGRTRA